MSSEKARSCVYDPLVEFLAHYSSTDAQIRFSRSERDTMTVEERLRTRIVDGDSIGIESDLTEALATYTPLDIINSVLLDGMKTVGDLFGSGQMQLPFVLQSAETMKAAVSWLEPYIEHSGLTARGTIVLATVKGDVHDIGKNLVDIILTNNGYRVINLGIKVSIDTMLSAIEEGNADVLGMSGLLVKSVVVMKENLELMNHHGIQIPIVLGGAALTRRYVEQELRPLYGGRIQHARDAFDGLHFMEMVMAEGMNVHSSVTEIKTGIDNSTTITTLTSKGETAVDTATMPVIGPIPDEKDQGSNTDRADLSLTIVRSAVAADVPVPSAPFLGSKVVNDIALDKVFEYINETALFRGQWQFRRSGKSAQETEKEIRNVIRPLFEEIKPKLKREAVLRPAVVYGYFPCASEGNDLIIYRPKELPDSQLHQVWPDTVYNLGSLVEWQRFSFPRQSEDRYLCIADFFRPVEVGKADVCAFHLVTMGPFASEYTAALFQSDRYQEYLYIHGMAVESAEALAEYWHKSIRTELGIAGNDAPELRRLFSQGYQGARYSFGYPACPNLSDHRQLFSLLQPERIGVSLTELYQLVPEQSTSAIIVHHPEAKYFNIKG